MLSRTLHTIQGRILLLGLAFLTAMMVNGFISQSTIETVRVNGYVYERIMSQKDLYVDLAPPPLNVVRSTLLVTGIDPGEKPEFLATIVDRLNKEKNEFTTSSASWRKRSTDMNERASLENIISIGENFYQIVDRELIPALRGGVKEKPNVDRLVTERLLPLQKQQSEGINSLILVTEQNLKQEQEFANNVVSNRRYILYAIFAATMAIAIALTYWLVINIRFRTLEAIHTVKAIASGDYTLRIADGSDEFAEIGQHVNDMAEYLRQVAEINKNQAIIEFRPDGTFLTANAKFLQIMGYTMDELRGQHHRFLVDPNHANGSEYRDFWNRLGCGESVSGEFLRMGRGGKPVWLNAVYTPIHDGDGNFLKVIKYATDVTDQVNLRLEIQRVLKQVNGSAMALASSSQELTTVSQQMAAAAEETATQANVASAAAEQVSHNVATVATGSEEMGASIKEIAKSANEAARVATTAVKVAERTNTTVAKLGESSAEIGNVIKVITSIAQQTNLLALNATIEAARAGEAGKGFAVVANEVKELAKQTAKATEDISRKIEAIQTDTKGAVEAIAQIGSIINQINDIQSTIATAVEEQTATTAEISRNVSEAAKGSSEIASNITGVAQAARSTTEGASNTKNAADDLSRMATDLQSLVSQFKA